MPSERMVRKKASVNHKHLGSKKQPQKIEIRIALQFPSLPYDKLKHCLSLIPNFASRREGHSELEIGASQ